APAWGGGRVLVFRDLVFTRPTTAPAGRHLLWGLVAGTSLGLLLPGACAGLPDGNCPGGKLALDGAMRSSSCSMRKRPSFSLTGSIASPFWKRDRTDHQRPLGRPSGRRAFSRKCCACAWGGLTPDRRTASCLPSSAERGGTTRGTRAARGNRTAMEQQVGARVGAPVSEGIEDCSCVEGPQRRLHRNNTYKILACRQEKKRAIFDLARAAEG